MVDMLTEENRILRQELDVCRDKVTKLHKVTLVQFTGGARKEKFVLVWDSILLLFLCLRSAGNRDPAGVRGVRKSGQVLLQEGGLGEDHEEQAGAGGTTVARLQQGSPR